MVLVGTGFADNRCDFIEVVIEKNHVCLLFSLVATYVICARAKCNFSLLHHLYVVIAASDGTDNRNRCLLENFWAVAIWALNTDSSRVNL